MIASLGALQELEIWLRERHWGGTLQEPITHR
jgi:hypothetical protein